MKSLGGERDNELDGNLRRSVCWVRDVVDAPDGEASRAALRRHVVRAALPRRNGPDERTGRDSRDGFGPDGRTPEVREFVSLWFAKQGQHRLAGPYFSG